MDINRLKTLSGLKKSKTDYITESFDQKTMDAIERNKGRAGEPLLLPDGSESKNAYIMSDRGDTIGVKRDDGTFIMTFYDTIRGEKETMHFTSDMIKAFKKIL